MKLLFATAIAAAMLVTPAFASKSQDAMKACATAWDGMSAADKAKTSYKDYSATCLKNGGPPAPAAAATTADTGKATPTTQQQKMTDCSAKWKAAKADGTTKGQTHKQFMSACLKGTA